jgi:hypothetical protein
MLRHGDPGHQLAGLLGEEIQSVRSKTMSGHEHVLFNSNLCRI